MVVRGILLAFVAATSSPCSLESIVVQHSGNVRHVPRDYPPAGPFEVAPQGPLAAVDREAIQGSAFLAQPVSGVSGPALSRLLVSFLALFLLVSRHHQTHHARSGGCSPVSSRRGRGPLPPIQARVNHRAMSFAGLRAEAVSLFGDRDPARSLADALRTEARLLSDLLHVLSQLKDGVVAEDLALVEEAVYSAQRVFRNLGQAGIRRRALLGILGGDGDIPLEDVEVLLGPKTMPEVAGALRELQQVAVRLSGELEINRKVLDAAIRSEAP